MQYKKLFVILQRSNIKIKNMKKKMFLIVALFCIVICKINAQEVYIPLQASSSSKDEVHNVPIRHVPKRISFPTVRLNGYQLTVNLNVEGANVSIVFYGIEGEVIFSQSFIASPKEISLCIPTEKLDVLQKIVVTIDSVIYWGEF